MRRHIVIGTFFISALLLISCASIVSPAPLNLKARIHTREVTKLPAYNFSFELPSGWQAQYIKEDRYRTPLRFAQWRGTQINIQALLDLNLYIHPRHSGVVLWVSRLSYPSEHSSREGEAPIGLCPSEGATRAPTIEAINIFDPAETRISPTATPETPRRLAKGISESVSQSDPLPMIKTPIVIKNRLYTMDIYRFYHKH